MAKAAKPLTLKQVKYIKGKVAGKTNAQAYRDAGYKASNKNIANVEGSKLLRKPNLQEALQAEFIKQGITLETIVRPIADGLTATKIVVMGKDSDDSFVDMTPDHSIRLKASGMAAQFMGIGKQANDITVNFISQAAEQRTVYDLS